MEPFEILWSRVTGSAAIFPLVNSSLANIRFEPINYQEKRIAPVSLERQSCLIDHTAFFRKTTRFVPKKQHEAGPRPVQGPCYPTMPIRANSMTIGGAITRIQWLIRHSADQSLSEPVPERPFTIAAVKQRPANAIPK